MTAPLIFVDNIRIDPGQIDALLSIGEHAFTRTSSSPGLSERCIRLLPGLHRHTCENEAGRPFTTELRDTETAHLVEHVTVELMALAGSPRSLKAETRWDFATDGRGRFHVCFAYDDDLVALGALKQAVPIVTWLLDPVGEPPSIEATVEALTSLRAMPHMGALQTDDDPIR